LEYISKRQQKQTKSWADSRQVSAESIQKKNLCKTAVIVETLTWEILFLEETTAEMNDVTTGKLLPLLKTD